MPLRRMPSAALCAHPDSAAVTGLAPQPQAALRSNFDDKTTTLTNNAVAGVRGTTFFTEALSDKKSYICACDGDIDLEGHNPKLKKAIQSNNEHKAFNVVTKGKRQNAKKQPRLHHTDEEKMALMPLLEAVSP